MGAQPQWSRPVDYDVPIKMTAQRVLKFLLYLIGVLTATLGLTGIVIAINSNFLSASIGICLGLGFLLAGIIVIFRTHRHFQGLSWLQSILWISTSTIIFFIAFILVVALYISTNKHIGGIFFYIVILLYGFALIFVAYKKPPLSQQISESVRNILETMPSKQISEYELFIYLQRKYQISEELLHQYLNGLSYIEQMDIPGTSAKVYRMKGIKEQLVFPQVTKITNPILRGNVERALSDLTEERVDIGLFLLGREFETTLKAFLLAAYAKGKLTSTPGNNMVVPFVKTICKQK